MAKRGAQPAPDAAAPAADDPLRDTVERGQRAQAAVDALTGPRAELPATVAALVPDPENRRQRTDRGRAMIVDSLKQTGAGRSIVIDENNQVLAGNGVLEAAPAAGIERVRIIETEGDELIAVRRKNLTPQQKRALAIFDNRTAELAEWNSTQLEKDRADGLDLQPFWTPEEEAALRSKWAEQEVGRMAADGEPVAGEPGHRRGTTTAGDHQTFAVPLTVDQERDVRAALRHARQVFEVTTAGDALAAALRQWMKTQEG